MDETLYKVSYLDAPDGKVQVGGFAPFQQPQADMDTDMIGKS